MKKEYTRHGGCYDRGAADSYYGRPRSPHYFVGATYASELVTNLTAEQIEDYNAGYDDNEATGNKKQY